MPIRRGTRAPPDKTSKKKRRMQKNMGTGTKTKTRMEMQRTEMSGNLQNKTRTGKTQSIPQP